MRMLSKLITGMLLIRIIVIGIFSAQLDRNTKLLKTYVVVREQYVVMLKINPLSMSANISISSQPKKI